MNSLMTNRDARSISCDMDLGNDKQIEAGSTEHEPCGACHLILS